MLDRATDTASVEELARKINGGALAVACVRHTHRGFRLGVHASCSLMWGIAAGFLGAYTLVLDLNIPLIVQPQLFGLFSLVSWGQVCAVAN